LSSAFSHFPFFRDISVFSSREGAAGGPGTLSKMTLFDTFCGKQGKPWEDLPLSGENRVRTATRRHFLAKTGPLCNPAPLFGENRPALQPGATFWLEMSRIKKYRVGKKRKKTPALENNILPGFRAVSVETRDRKW